MHRFAVVPCLLSLLAAPSAVQADRLRYDIYVGGVHAAELTVNMALDGSKYAMSIEGRTRGMTEWLLGWRISSMVEGERGESGVSPSYQRSLSRFRGTERSVDIRFGDGKILGWSVTPPEEPDPDRVPVTLAETTGAVDMMSGLLGALLDSADGRCPERARVFDGRRRTDLMFLDMGTVRLKPTTYGIYQGDAFRCLMTVERIAGYLKRETEWNRAEDRGRPATIFMQQAAPGLPPIPVRVESDLTLGQVVVHLTGVDETDVWPRLGPLPTD
ncbi:DUF3108 domain-containing protein [Lacibacterium aquatile]|uniref:DUF3108 domain-containing protein n=1 Tax=Lacibacterium aquatile TaxID=1168082 RepID=A0ABW5DTX6_9PROT